MNIHISRCPSPRMPQPSRACPSLAFDTAFFCRCPTSPFADRRWHTRHRLQRGGLCALSLSSLLFPFTAFRRNVSQEAGAASDGYFFVTDISVLLFFCTGISLGPKFLFFGVVQKNRFPSFIFAITSINVHRFQSLQRVSIYLAILSAVLAIVNLSDRLSQSGIVSKRLKLGSWDLHLSLIHI